MDAKIAWIVLLLLGAGAAWGEVHPEDVDPLRAPPAWLAPGAASPPASAVSDAFQVDEPPALPKGLRELPRPKSPPKTHKRARDTQPGQVRQAANWVSPSSTPAGGFAQLEKQANQAATRADLTSVILACSREGTPAPEFAALLAWAHNRRGEMAAADGDTLEAFDDFQHAVAIDADYWPALHNRGVTLAELDRHAEAIVDFDRVIEINPRSAIAYRNRAEARINSGRLHKGVQDYTAAMALGPVDASLLAARADTYHRLGQIDLAVADLNLALQIEPQNPTALAQRGAVYAQVGNFRQAIADLEAAVEQAPDSPPGLRSLAWLLATCPEAEFQRPQRAVILAKHAVRLAAESLSDDDPGDGDTALHLDTLAAAHAAAGDFDAAVRHSEHAVAIAPPEYRRAMQRRLRGFQRGDAFQTRRLRR